MIQVFIRIIFRSIGRQEKHLNFILVVFQPGRSKLFPQFLEPYDLPAYLLESLYLLSLSLYTPCSHFTIPPLLFLTFSSKIIYTNAQTRGSRRCRKLRVCLLGSIPNPLNSVLRWLRLCEPDGYFEKMPLHTFPLFQPSSCNSSYSVPLLFPDCRCSVRQRRSPRSAQFQAGSIH